MEASPGGMYRGCMGCVDTWNQGSVMMQGYPSQNIHQGI